MIKLVDVYEHGEVSTFHASVLYKLLEERPSEANISHREMPSFEAHCNFVKSRPYAAWYFIEAPHPIGIVGSIYLTNAREVGIFIFVAHQIKGFGRQALARFRELHPGRLLANVAPSNHRSILFFKRVGARHIQNTYEL